MIEHDIECTEVYETYDRAYLHVAYFVNYSDATAFIASHKDRNYMSCRPFKRTFQIMESIDDMATALADRKKAAALAKLSEEEKKILGL
jgi:hypothetical protein